MLDSTKKFMGKMEAFDYQKYAEDNIPKSLDAKHATYFTLHCKMIIDEFVCGGSESNFIKALCKGDHWLAMNKADTNNKIIMGFYIGFIGDKVPKGLIAQYKYKVGSQH